MAKTKVAPAMPKKQAPRARTLTKLPAAARRIATVEDVQEMDDAAKLISELVGVVQEQIDEYKSLLEDVVEKATGRSLWAPCDLADAGGDYQTLNRKSGAIWYLLMTIGEKADALQSRVFALRPTAPKAAA